VKGQDAEDGMVTAELAVALPALMVVVAGALALLVGVAGQLRVTDAAGVAARAAARGDPAAAIVAAAQSVAPSAVVTTSRAGGWVTVVVRLHVGLPGPAGLAGVEVAARAGALDETSLQDTGVDPAAP